MTRKILVSACLLGSPVRYNGAAKTLVHPALDAWRREGRVVSVCPELSGGFGVPRPAAEIARALLRQHGIEVFADSEIDALSARLAREG